MPPQPMVGANQILFRTWIEFTGGRCNFISLDENSQANCKELQNICKHGTSPAPTQKGTTQTAQETQSSTETATPNVTQTGTTNMEPGTTTTSSTNTSTSTGTSTSASTALPSLEPGAPGPEQPTTIASLPSWSLKWCPRRIGSNPNRHFYTLTFGKICFQIFLQAEEIPSMLLSPNYPKTKREAVGLSSQVLQAAELSPTVHPIWKFIIQFT